MTKKKRAETLPDQLQLLYSSCVTEIGAFKEQQWKTTNYALLVYAAIVSVAKTTKALDALEFVVLLVVAIAVLGTALSIVLMLDESIQVRRTRLTEIRKQFADEFMIAWGGGKPLKEIVDDPNQKSRLEGFFNSVLLLGFAATFWLLAREIPCAS